MSAENDNIDSSSSDSDMDQDTPQLKSGFRGEGDDIMPVRYILFKIVNVWNFYNLLGKPFFYISIISEINC